MFPVSLFIFFNIDITLLELRFVFLHVHCMLNLVYVLYICEYSSRKPILIYKKKKWGKANSMKIKVEFSLLKSSGRNGYPIKLFLN